MELVITILVGLAGMVAHFLKRKIKKENYPGLNPIEAFFAYIKGHPVYTIMATDATIGGSILLVPASLPPIGPEWVAIFTPVFTLGYMCDSAINKAVETS